VEDNTNTGGHFGSLSGLDGGAEDFLRGSKAFNAAEMHRRNFFPNANFK